MSDMVLEHEALAARVHRLEIRAELSDLVARYGQLLDARNWDELSESFATGGTLSFAGGSVTGREALKAFYAEQLGRTTSHSTTRTRNCSRSRTTSTPMGS
jgi:SnoaL-like domain